MTTKIRVTTRIAREEMGIAAQADPRKKRVHWRQKNQGRDMVESILVRMDKLIGALVSRSFYRFAHYTDRAQSIEDMVATVRGELVLAIYRYHTDGKYSPYNYLMGVATVVLKNIHNRRNRKKRIPGAKMLSIDAPSKAGIGFETDGVEDSGVHIQLPENQDTKDMNALVTRLDVESMFHVLRGRTARIAFRNYEGRIRRKKVDYYEILSLILSGYGVCAIAKIYDVPRHTMRSIIRDRIVRILDKD